MRHTLMILKNMPRASIFFIHYRPSPNQRMPGMTLNKKGLCLKKQTASTCK
jgi:hypothetical protein